MNIKNGYTSTKEILEIKNEIRKNKIRICRMTKITLDMLQNNNSKPTKSVDDIIDVINYLSEKNKNLGIQLCQLRQIVSDNIQNTISTINQLSEKNDILSDKKGNSIETFTDNLIEKYDLSNFSKVKVDDKVVLTYGFNQIVIEEVEEDNIKDISEDFISEADYLELNNKMLRLKLNKLSSILSSSFIREDSKFLNIFLDVFDDHVKCFKVSYNFK